MVTVKEILERANAIVFSNKERASAANVRYKFVLNGDAICTFVLDLTEAPGVSEGDGAADCTFRMGAADFIRLADGEVDSRELFFSGKLKVDGDMGLALKLKKLMAPA